MLEKLKNFLRYALRIDPPCQPPSTISLNNSIVNRLNRIHRVSRVESSYIVVKKGRIQTVKAHGITSIYKKLKRPGQLWDVSAFKKGAFITPDMFTALHEALSHQIPPP